METPPPVALVIDHDPDVRAVLKHMLRTLGLETVTAAGGVYGIGEFSRHASTLRLVLLDVQMPGMDGPTTLRYLRAIDSPAAFYFVTGGSGRYTLPELLAGGARGVLRKPVDLRVLAEVVSALADRGSR